MKRRALSIQARSCGEWGRGPETGAVPQAVSEAARAVPASRAASRLVAQLPVHCQQPNEALMRTTDSCEPTTAESVFVVAVYRPCETSFMPL